ncbi:hypothetical protein QJS10_CPB12g00870 [Acorus calamus]|uniref:Endonuclease/exonuclease/phosphatase domain-containing protein n=1 Tax=Acorus calamus TaxID=4465 RepID=A0AAV9DMW9_ACOCL|nr:hypothetical protein QJS10_CPB12g00870 [Acorus calamus]
MRSAPTFARLDQVLVCADWEDKFPLCSASGLPRTMSDHVPILLQSRVPNSKKGQFHFENLWSDSEDLADIVQDSWNRPTGELLGARRVAFKLKRLKAKFKSWGHQRRIDRNKDKVQWKKEIATMNLIERVMTFQTMRDHRGSRQRRNSQ